MIEPRTTEATSHALPAIPMALPSQELLALELPAFVDHVEALALGVISFRLESGDLEVDAVERDKAKWEGLAHAWRRMQDSQDRAHRAELIVCAHARAIGSALGPGKPGRPGAGESIPLPELEDPTERKRYRACAEPTPEEFRAWALDVQVASVWALAKHGAKLKAERDRDTGAPYAPPPPPQVPAPSPGGIPQDYVAPEQGADDPPRADRDVKPENVPVETPAPTPPAPHRRRVWTGLVSRLADELGEWAEEAEAEAEFSPDDAQQIGECVRGARALRDQLTSTLTT